MKRLAAEPDSLKKITTCDEMQIKKAIDVQNAYVNQDENDWAKNCGEENSSTAEKGLDP